MSINTINKYTMPPSLCFGKQERLHHSHYREEKTFYRVQNLREVPSMVRLFVVSVGIHLPGPVGKSGRR